MSICVNMCIGGHTLKFICACVIVIIQMHVTNNIWYIIYCTIFKIIDVEWMLVGTRVQGNPQMEDTINYNINQWSKVHKSNNFDETIC